MSGRGRRVDVRIAHTVAYLLRCPRSSVPEAMRACKFTDKESCNPAKQMAVRRAFTKALGGKRKSPPTSSIDDSTVGLSVLSPLTEPTTTTPSGSSGNSETLVGGDATKPCYSLGQRQSRYGLRLRGCSNGELINSTQQSIKSARSRGRQVGMQGRRRNLMAYLRMQLQKR